MNFGKIVFSQILELIHPQQFHRCVNRYPMKRISRSFSAWDQFLCMAFALSEKVCATSRPVCVGAAIFTSWESRAMSLGQIWLMPTSTGTGGSMKHSLKSSSTKHAGCDESTGLNINEMVYAVDASTIDLCLSVFPWASFRKAKGAIKLHTQIELLGPIPVFIRITDGSVHDVHFLDQIIFEAGSIYVFDRGYLDFDRLYRIEKANAYFVIRSKKNTRFYVLKSRPVDKSTGLRCDKIIRLSSAKGKRNYPKH